VVRANHGAFSLTLSPVVRYLQRRGIAAWFTALMLVAAIIAIIAAGIFFLSGPVSHWLDMGARDSVTGTKRSD